MSTKDRRLESSPGSSDTQKIELKIKISNRHVAHLDEVCKARELSRDEAIEQALKSYLREHARRARLTAFGLWKTRERKGVDAQTALRAKW